MPRPRERQARRATRRATRRPTAFFVFADTVARAAIATQERARLARSPVQDRSAWGKPRGRHPCPSARRGPGTRAGGARRAGVNLIFGVLSHETPPELIASLLDGSHATRLGGGHDQALRPAFPADRHRLMSCQLVEQGLTDASMLTAMARSCSRRRSSISGRSWSSAEASARHEAHARPPRERAGAVRARAQLDGAEPVVLMEMTLRSLTDDRGVDHETSSPRGDPPALGNHS